MEKYTLSSWPAGGQNKPDQQKPPSRHTAVEDELQFNQIHVHKLRVDCLVRNPHTNVLHLNEVTLQRILKSILEYDEIVNLMEVSGISLEGGTI